MVKYGGATLTAEDACTLLGCRPGNLVDLILLLGMPAFLHRGADWVHFPDAFDAPITAGVLRRVR